MHKVTFVDQIQNQVKTYQDKAYKDINTEEVREGNKTIYNATAINKKIITLDSDKSRGIVNIYYIESYKRYNAMPPEGGNNENAGCMEKC